MKKHIITALLITAMISMTACGKNNTDTPAEETVAATEVTVENPTANDEKVVLGTVNKEEETTTAETTAEAKSDAKTTTSPDPKATEVPKSTAAPETTAKPKSTETPKATTKPGTQTASVTATTKPVATEKPQSTTAPKATATPAPKATETPKATPAPVACQHTNYHIENGHDTENVPIAGGCYDVYNYSTKVCNDCGYSFGEARNKVNTVHHGCVISEGVSATCTTDGRTTVWGCDCGGSGTTGGDVIPAFGHSYHEVFDHSEEIPNDDGVSVTTKFYYRKECYTCGDVAEVYEK